MKFWITIVLVFYFLQNTKGGGDKDLLYYPDHESQNNAIQTNTPVGKKFMENTGSLDSINLPEHLLIHNVRETPANERTTEMHVRQQGGQSPQDTQQQQPTGTIPDQNAQFQQNESTQQNTSPQATFPQDQQYQQGAFPQPQPNTEPTQFAQGMQNMAPPQMTNMTPPLTTNMAPPQMTNMAPPPQVQNMEQPQIPTVAYPQTSNMANPQTTNMAQPQMQNTEQPQNPNTAYPQMSNMAHPQMPNTAQTQMPNMAQMQMPNTAHPQMPNTAHPQTTNMGPPQMQSMVPPQMQSMGQPQMQSMGQPQMQSMGQPQMQSMGQPQMPNPQYGNYNPTQGMQNPQYYSQPPQFAPSAPIPTQFSPGSYPQNPQLDPFHHNQQPPWNNGFIPQQGNYPFNTPYNQNNQQYLNPPWKQGGNNQNNQGLPDGLLLNSPESQVSYSYLTAMLSGMLNDPNGREALLLMVTDMKSILSNPNALKVIQAYNAQIQDTLNNPNKLNALLQQPTSTTIVQTAPQGGIVNSLMKKGGILTGLLRNVALAKTKAVNELFEDIPLVNTIVRMGTGFADSGLSMFDSLTSSFQNPGPGTTVTSVTTSPTPKGFSGLPWNLNRNY